MMKTRRIFAAKNKSFWAGGRSWIGSNSRAFTLIETLVAVSIFMVAIAGPLTVIRLALSTASVSKDQISAFYLAQDAIEYIKNNRNTNGKNGDDWLTSMDACIDTDCSLDTTISNPTIAFAADDGTCSPLRFNTTTKQYGCGSGGSWQPSPFTRVVRLEPGTNQDQEMIANVTVSWTSGSFSRSLVVTQSFFNIADAIAQSKGGTVGN